MSFDSKIICLLADFASGPRPPNDPFFAEGNQSVTHLKKFGICEDDNEDFLHEPVKTFSCTIFGCRQLFDSVFQFEQHYNSSHRYSCSDCKKTLASPHLLDLHVSERHDSFFAVQAEKKPMCYVEDCKTFYQTSQLRKSHCMKEHNFPSSFWLDKPVTVSKSEAKNSKTPKSTQVKTDVPKNNLKSSRMKRSNEKKCRAVNESERMEVEEEAKKPEKKALGSASCRRRQKILVTFTKDLKASLPDIEPVNKNSPK